MSGRENEINSITEILQSRFLLEKVVDAVGPQAILKGTEAGETGASPAPPLASAARNAAQQSTKTAKVAIESDWPRTTSDRDRAIIKLQEMIEVQAIKKSDVVRIACSTHSPRLAQQIVAQLVHYYLDEHLRLNRTPGADEFLERKPRKCMES